MVYHRGKYSAFKVSSILHCQKTMKTSCRLTLLTDSFRQLDQKQSADNFVLLFEVHITFGFQSEVPPLFLDRMENSTKTTEKHISKEKLSQLISNGDSSITLQKRKQTDTISKLWIHFSVIHFQKIKQDYVICDSCKSLISYKP